MDVHNQPFKPRRTMSTITVAARSSEKRCLALIASPTIKPLLVALELDPVNAVLTVQPNPEPSADKHSKYLVIATKAAPLKVVEPPKPAVKAAAKKTTAKAAPKSPPVAKAA
jgi:hypothetical protein